MAYNESLANKVRKSLTDMHVTEKKMFGGLCFMVNGHMCCGIVGDELMVRVGPEAYGDALELPHARPMDFTGRPLKGMVYVSTDGVRRQPSINQWVRRGLAFVESLPPK